MTNLKPLDDAVFHRKGDNNAERIQYARCLLYFHGFMSECENKKVLDRIDKWLAKNNVSMQTPHVPVHRRRQQVEPEHQILKR